MTATNNLPEFASHLAVYLRYATGDSHIFARVIPGDQNEWDVCDYIVVGHCVAGVEDEWYYVQPSEVYPGWMLTRLDHYPDTRSEPGYTDTRVVGDEMHATAVLAMIAEHMFRDKLASAQECLVFDLNHPESVP